MSTEKQPETPAKHDAARPVAPQAKAPPASEEAPDPDEDDLDDLDEVLDEFSPSKPSVRGSRSVGDASVSGPSDPDEPNFDEQLQKEMARLMGNVDENPEMQGQLEEMMKEIGSVVEQQMKQDGSLEGSSKDANPASKDNFEDVIRKTMERMQHSGDQATKEATADSTDDFMAEMLKQMQGNGSEEDFSKMLLGMMDQLTNKEILYEPMKDLHTKFPDWIEKNKGKTPAEDMTRYQEQQKLVNEIVTRFERKEYSDDNADDREYIVERMQQMQAAGSPPSDLVGDMDDAQKAFGDLESGCPQQ